MELVARLFGEAWDHRRQRHRSLVAGAAVVMVAGAIVAGLLVGRHQSPAKTLVSDQRSARILAGSYVSLDPDQQLGDHCAVINSVACDTLTVELELHRAATSVVASMGSRVVRLTATPKEDGFPLAGQFTLSRGSGPWHVFSGELLPAGGADVVRHQKTMRARKRGAFPYVHVRLVITYANGSNATDDFRTLAIRAYDFQHLPLQSRVSALEAHEARSAGR